MTESELRTALDWAANEGWNPGLADAAAFLAADPDGFLMGRVDGEPVVSISAVTYGRDYGFIGLYVCRPQWRGHAFGTALARAALARLSNRTSGLDGVVERVENYRRLGFTLAHRNMRFGGELSVDDPGDPRVETIDAAMFDMIAAYDAPLFGAPRGAFLHQWLLGSGTRTGLALVDGGRVTGYGVIRDCREGYKIGPLFADDAQTADLLFRALAARRSSGIVYLDVAEPNTAARALAERYGMSLRFETARMYRGPAPAIPLGRVFGITSFELG